MRLARRDQIATALVAVSVLLYVLWRADSTLPGMSSIRASGTVVLVLGFAASASAVVPTFDALLRGNKAYLAVTSLVGVLAFIGGLLMLISESETGFAVMVASMAVLWLVSTTHHGLLARNAPPPPPAEPPNVVRRPPSDVGR